MFLKILKEKYVKFNRNKSRKCLTFWETIFYAFEPTKYPIKTCQILKKFRVCLFTKISAYTSGASV